MQLTHLPLTLHNVSVTLKPLAASVNIAKEVPNFDLGTGTGTAAVPMPSAAASPSAPDPAPAPATAAPPKAASATKSATAKSDQATQDFLAYMKETPAQRLEDAWLASHHLTRKDLEAMSPEQRKAIEKQMETEIEAQIKQAAQSRPKTNIVV